MAIGPTKVVAVDAGAGLVSGAEVSPETGVLAGVPMGAAVAATVGRGVSLSSETVRGIAASGTMAILSLVQTAARVASGAIAAETIESLAMEPSVWPAPLATLQLPSVARHWAEL